MKQTKEPRHKPGLFFCTANQRKQSKSATWHEIFDIMAAIVYVDSMAILATDRPGSTPSANQKCTVVPFQKRASSLGLTAIDTPALIRQIDAGFSFDTLRNLASHTGIDLTRLATVVGIPDRTLARRKAANTLAPEESERLLRISYVFEKAVGLFHGDIEAAVHWLTNPKKALGYEQPLTYARTELGAREVENLIGRIQHGVFS